MFIAINKRFKKIKKRVYLIEGIYYTKSGKIINPDTHYICTTKQEEKKAMSSIYNQTRVKNELRLKWKKV